MNTVRAFIFVNGELANPEVIREMVRPGDYMVAVDGGLRHMTQLGFTPALLIGDLDSVDPAALAALRSAGVRVEQHPVEKDETDLELALTTVAAQGYAQIRVVAALGGRIDQTLANLFLLMLPGLEDLDVRLVDGREEIMIIRKAVTIEGKPGDTVSLLPLDGKAFGVLTDGLRYPLREETLCPNRTRGISNEMLSEQASVRLQSGKLLCIHTHRRPEEIYPDGEVSREEA